ncbi:MAG: GNAT family N-acetyltransferase [Pirellulales bacterium]
MFLESITTERLLLRAPRLEDATAIFSRYASNPAVTRNLSWPTHTSPADTRRFLQLAEQLRADGSLINWAICTRDDGRLHGMIGVRPDFPRVEVGYVLAQDRWGHGLMTEALHAVVAEVREHADVWRIQAHCATDNAASARVLEKAGFELEGVARRYFVLPNRGPEPVDAKLYAMIVR